MRYFLSEKLLREHRKLNYICDLVYQQFDYVWSSFCEAFSLFRLWSLGWLAGTLFGHWHQAGIDRIRDDEVFFFKIVWVDLESSKWFTKRLLASTPGKPAWTFRETLYQFAYDILTVPPFYERSYNLFVGEKAKSMVEFNEINDTVDQKTRQQCSQKQVIDTSRRVDTSLIDEFRPTGKISEGFGIASSWVVSWNGAFGRDLFVEVEDTIIAESCSRIRIPCYGDVMETGTAVELTEDVGGQINWETYRAALTDYENSGFRKVSTEKTSRAECWVVGTRWASCLGNRVLRFKRWTVEWWLFVWRYFGYRFFGCRGTWSQRCEKRDKFCREFEISSMLQCNFNNENFWRWFQSYQKRCFGAWSLIELETGGLDQKSCNATRKADETQMCTTECTVDTS